MHRLDWTLHPLMTRVAELHNIANVYQQCEEKQQKDDKARHLVSNVARTKHCCATGNGGCVHGWRKKMCCEHA